MHPARGWPAGPTTPATCSLEDPLRPSHLAGLSVALLVGALLRFYRLDAQPIWLDEAYTWDAAHLVRSNGPLAVAGFDHISPLYYWLAAVATQIGVDSAWWLRLPSALAGILCIPLVFMVVRRIFGNVGVALASALVMAISPFALWFSQEARSYTLVILLSLIYVWACWPLNHIGGVNVTWRHTAAVFAGITVTTTIGLWVHHIFIYLIAAWGIWLIWRLGPRSSVLWVWIGTQVVAVLAFVPWLILTSDRLHKSAGLVKSDSLAWVPYTYFEFFTGQSFGPSTRELRELGTLSALRSHPLELAVAILAVVFIGRVGPAVLHRLNRSGMRWLTMWAIVPIILLMVSTYTVGIGYNPRYVSTAFPAIVVLLGASIASFRRGWIGFLAATLAVAVMSYADAAWFLNATYAKDDLRSVQNQLAMEMDTGDVLIIGNSSAIVPMEVYGFVCPSQAFVIRDDRAASALANAPVTSGHTFILENRQWEVLPSPILQLSTARLGSPTSVSEWPGVRLIERPSAVLPDPQPGLDAGCGR